MPASLQHGFFAMGWKKTKNHTKAGGFNLIELLAGIAVAAIVLTIGVPSFQSFTQQNRLTAATNDLFSSIYLARSEAIKRGFRVTLCPSNDASSCTSGSEWHHGWILFEDPNNNAQRDNGETLLEVRDQQPGDLSITGNTPVRSYLSYIPIGMTRAISGALQMGTITLCLDGNAREIVINSAGRPRIDRDAGC